MPRPKRGNKFKHLKRSIHSQNTSRPFSTNEEVRDVLDENFSESSEQSNLSTEHSYALAAVLSVANLSHDEPSVPEFIDVSDQTINPDLSKAETITAVTERSPCTHDPVHPVENSGTKDLSTQRHNSNDVSGCITAEDSSSQVTVLTKSVRSETPASDDSVEILLDVGNLTKCYLPVLENFEWKDPDYGNPTQNQAFQFIQSNLPELWICRLSEDGFHLMMICREKKSAVQREVIVDFKGTVEIYVHRKSLKPDIFDEIVSNAPPSVSLTDASWRNFSERAVLLVRRVNAFKVCRGAALNKYKDLWPGCVNGTVDENPYGEETYTETCRSKSCCFLIDPKKRKCHECYRITEGLRKKRLSHQSSSYHPKTANVNLDEAQKMAKLKDQQKDIRIKQRIINQLTKKIEEALDRDGVTVDKEMNDFLMKSLESAEATPGSVFEKFTSLQKLFLREQIRVSSVKGPSGVTWHPAIIRLALLVRNISKSAYNALRDCGVFRLPSDRTLYDYSHIQEAKEGCQLKTLDKIAAKVKTFPDSYQLYHVMMMDEMHISKKLVYLKSTGEMIGYVNLSDVEKELHDLETFINSEDNAANVNPPPLATQMLTFMIKGVANDIKETVATFTTHTLNQYELYSRFWEVMVQLEKRGIRIIAAVADGSSVNRAFFKMHTPFTKLPSQLVFDTLNLCAIERVLYFISDVPHLLKTARNCFYKSGFGPSYSRLLTLNGEHIVWQTIRNMYNGERTKTWRRCRKLNGQNVNLNSYSRMRVSYAAQVLSNTVSTDLQLLGWDGTNETVRFIKSFNDFFDMLNGAYSVHHVRTKNENLAPYCCVNDPRFDKLMDFLNYLDSWSKQVDGLEGFSKAQKQKMTISRETLEGIEITIRGFISATKFLLSEGTKFVNARIFCQDPLEQYHSKQRANVGGSSNPNVQQFLHSDIKIGVLREVSDVSVRHRKGNVKAPDEAVQISDEPLPKRKKH